LRRRQAIIIILAALLAAGLSSTLFLTRATSASTGGESRSAVKARTFVGYWMGIDPLDGGDSRRGITSNDDRTFSVIGRDTVFTLCDNTDRAIITSGDAAIVDSALVADNVVLTCTNTGDTVSLKVRYDPIDRNILRETVTMPNGERVDEIIFHRVSE
jgi:hypothetical protein